MMLLIGLKWAFEKHFRHWKIIHQFTLCYFWTSIVWDFYGTFHIEWCIWLSNEHLAGHITWKDWNWTTSVFSLSAYIVAKFNPRFFQKRN